MIQTYSIAVLGGDGIGPEVVAEGLKVLRAVEARVPGVNYRFVAHSVGAAEFLHSGDPLSAATLEKIKEADAILLGAMGLPEVRWPSGVEMTPQPASPSTSSSSAKTARASSPSASRRAPPAAISRPTR